jgi:glutathione peroxidase
MMIHVLGDACSRMVSPGPPGGSTFKLSSAADWFFPPIQPHNQRKTVVTNRVCLVASLAGFAALVLLFVPLGSVSASDEGKKPTGVLDFHVKDIDGKDVDLASYKGKVLLIVNTASQCGFTPQYKDMEEIYEKYKDKGFEILAFPANEFGKQEPGTNDQIKDFCATKYKVSFPLFSKIVVKGKGIDPLYNYLTSDKTNPKFSGTIPWNFTKFLVNRKGEVIARFKPQDKPSSDSVTKAIDKALAEEK